MATEATLQKAVEIPPMIVVRDLAERLGISPVALLKALIANGIMVSITESIDYETAAIVAEDLGFTLLLEGTAARQAEAAALAQQQAAAATAAGATAAVTEPGLPWYLVGEPADQLVERAPVVAVMGHVDHGKTSLLDSIRQTKVAAGESGGITQHIGAYTVQREGGAITFIDTPGHEAFTAMRARGAQATDIAVIVVAADDGVMPQTREAIDHAKAAGVPIIVAINKTDLPGARPDRAMEQLAGVGLVPDAWGGDTFMIPVSAVTGKGIDELLDAILLVAEAHPPLANPTRAALGTVLEGRIEQNKGVLATFLVQSGTLKQGDFVVIDSMYGKARAMFDPAGKRVNEAKPSTAVEIMGLPSVPDAGARFEVVPNEKTARALVEHRMEATRDAAGDGATRPLTLDELFARSAAGEIKTLNLIVKTDVQGTLEPVVAELNALAGEIGVKILTAATGEVSEADVNLAVASNAVIIAFRVGVDSAGSRAVAARNVEVRHYDVIYKMKEDIEDALKGMLEPVYEEQVIGRAEVRAIFNIPRQGKIAGCMVTSGTIRRGATIRIIRGGEVIATSPVGSLKRVTEDVREVREGFECGVGFANFGDAKVGDVLEFFTRERTR